MTAEKTSQIIVRKAVPNDQDFIYQTWLRGYRLSPFARSIYSKTYYKYHVKIIDHLLDQSEIWVASNPDYLDQIYGYMVAEHGPKNTDILHWIYVKLPFRRMGIGSEILESFMTGSRLIYTHMVRDFLLSKATKVSGEGLKDEVHNYNKHRSREYFFLEKFNATYNPYFAFKEARQWEMDMETDMDQDRPVEQAASA